jgi:hypothetical protein
MMKLLHTRTAICTSIQTIGSVAHAVSFHEAIEDSQKHGKPPWVFVVPGLKINFEIGKAYVIQVCDPLVPNE